MHTTNEVIAPRKRLILETAAGLFIEKGFHQTSIREIAKAANISLGNLYNHFSGKEELIIAIALLEAEENVRLEAILQQHSTPAKSYQRFIDNYLAIHTDEGDAVLSAEIMAEALRNPEVGVGFIENHQRLAGKLGGLLTAGKAAGVMDFEDTAEMVASLIIDVLESGCVKSLIYEAGEKKPYLAQLKRLCLQAVAAET